MNRALVDKASALAEEESLSCELMVANAFTLSQPAHVYVSSGVVHHFRGSALEAFFAGQKNARGFLHFDMQYSKLSPIGSWIFHQARMRVPLARHVGVASAARAHSAGKMLAASRKALGFTCAGFDQATSFASVLVRPMHAVVGTRPELWSPFVDALGPLRERLGDGR